MLLMAACARRSILEGRLAQTSLLEVCDVPKGHANPFPQTIAARILEPRMPIYHRTYSPGELQFITPSTYRRAPIFFSPRFCRCFVQRLEEVRQKMNCLLIGWVLMPEHFYLPLKPQPAESTPLVVKELKEEAAQGTFKTAI
jgi:hypothetical protein